MYATVLGSRARGRAGRGARLGDRRTAVGDHPVKSIQEVGLRDRVAIIRTLISPALILALPGSGERGLAEVGRRSLSEAGRRPCVGRAAGRDQP